MSQTAVRGLSDSLVGRAVDQIGTILLWFVIAAGPLLVLSLLYTGQIPDRFVAGPVFHFYVVTGTSIVVFALAFLMRTAAAQLGDPRALFLSLAFLSMAGLFTVHALLTPGVLVEMNPWVGLSAGLAPAVTATFLLLGTVNWSPGVRASIIDHQRLMSWGVITGVGAFAALAIVTAVTNSYPGALPETLRSPIVDHVLLAATSGMLVYVVGHYAWIYRNNGSPLVVGILISAIFLAQGQVSAMFAPIWHLSWWIYHFLLLAGFGSALALLTVEYANTGSIRTVVGKLLLQDSMTQLQRGYTDVIVALIEAVEARDPYTHGHTQKVCELSQLMAHELGLSREDQRVTMRAAVLHDIGKIAVPDAILNKEGSLTRAEYDLAKEHPNRGYRMIRHVSSLRREADGIRYHHERLDGSGYPDGLQGDEIPVIARIIAVADVFDALTSDRPYRRAYPVDRALEMIIAERGTRLDAECVDALLRVLSVWKSHVESFPSSRIHRKVS